MLSTVTRFGIVLLINGVFYGLSKYVITNISYHNNPILYEGNFIITIITIGILMVIFEEILFRGFIMERLLEVGSSSFAIVMQGVLFSISHLNLVSGVSVFLVGIL